jgi:transposase-like protein
MKRPSSPFKWRHYAPDVILLCLRRYCRYSLSYRDLAEMMQERGLTVHRVITFRWVQRYAPEINKRIGTDKHASYPEAFAASVKEKVLPPDCKLRRVKYLNNIIEQDHRAIQRRWRAMQCFRAFHTAERTPEGTEALHMMKKGQVERLDGRDSAGQAKVVESLFGVAA